MYFCLFKVNGVRRKVELTLCEKNNLRNEKSSCTRYVYTVVHSREIDIQNYIWISQHKFTYNKFHAHY